MNLHLATLAGDGEGPAQAVPAKPGGGQLRLDEATAFITGEFEGEVEIQVSIDGESWTTVGIHAALDGRAIRLPCNAPLCRAVMKHHERGTAKVTVYFP